MKTAADMDLKSYLIRRRDELLLDTQQGMKILLTGEVRQGIGSGREEGDFAAANHLEYLRSQRFTYQHRLIRQIDAALERMREGTFGLCAECGDEIGTGRLAILPFVILCCDCQRQRERCLVHG